MEIRITLKEFRDRVYKFAWTSTINQVHWHHTYKPNHDTFYKRGGKRVVADMRRYHVKTRGWRAPGQHITIDPEGYIWLGRNWNWAPASSVGHNGRDNGTHPFMFEMIGDFRNGHDALTGAQLDTALLVTATILNRFNQHAGDETIRFHKEMAPTACPGDLDKSAIIKGVRNVQSKINTILADRESNYSPQPGDGKNRVTLSKLFGCDR